MNDREKKTHQSLQRRSRLAALVVGGWVLTACIDVDVDPLSETSTSLATPVFDAGSEAGALVPGMADGSVALGATSQPSVVELDGDSGRTTIELVLNPQTDASFGAPDAAKRAGQIDAACEPECPRDTDLDAGGDAEAFDAASPEIGPGTDAALPVCGNKLTESGELCDDGVDSANCNGPGGAAAGVACMNTVCGDGYVNSVALEECDDGPNGSEVCDADCTLAKCGDGYTNAQAGEACDFGSTSDTTTCNGSAAPEAARCQPAVCGDGHLNAAAGEECDPGGDTAQCNGPTAGAVACKASRCGDGYTNPITEDCDTADSSGCPSTCVFL